MCGKYQKGRQNIKTPNSGKRTRCGGRGGGREVGLNGWQALGGGTWQDEHWVLFCMLVNWTPIKNKFIKKRKKEKKERGSTRKKIHKIRDWIGIMMTLNSYLSIVTLNVNGLNDSIKRCRDSDWIKKQDPSICCLLETHFRCKDTTAWK